MNRQLFSLKMVIGCRFEWTYVVVILWICSALQAVLIFSAWEKSRDSIPNSQKLEEMYWSFQTNLVTPIEDYTNQTNLT